VIRKPSRRKVLTLTLEELSELESSDTFVSEGSLLGDLGPLGEILPGFPSSEPLAKTHLRT